MLSTKYVTKVSIIAEKITGCTGCTVDASCNNAVRHKEGNHRKEETHRSYESDGEISTESEFLRRTHS